jgi:hypothetical protein
MSDELTLEQLEQVKQLSYIHPNMYVYYNDFGNILSISNVKESSKDYLEVPEEKLKDFLSGKKDFGRYKIDYFKFNYENSLADESSIDTSNSLIYTIPIVDSETLKDLTIIFDKTNKTWQFVLNNNGIQTVHQHSIDKVYSFFIVKDRDPHYLIETLQVTGHELIDSIVLKCNYVPKIPSITTMKQFNSYGLVIR